MSCPNASIASLEFRFTLDRALAAHEAGDADVADAFARVAEAIVRSAFPEVADDIASAASRKGQGDVIGARLAQHLDAASAACVAMVLVVRGARRPVVHALSAAFGRHPQFIATIRALCGRAFEAMPTPRRLDASPMSASIEVAAPSGR